jgi:hypothetical protein
VTNEYSPPNRATVAIGLWIEIGFVVMSALRHYHLILEPRQSPEISKDMDRFEISPQPEALTVEAIGAKTLSHVSFL